MACADEDETKLLAAKFEEFVKLSGAAKQGDCKRMNSKACGKMVKDMLPKEVCARADSSVFPKHKEKGGQYMHVDHFPEFIRDCAHECVKVRTKNEKIAKDDPKVVECDADFRQRILNGGPKVKEVKESITGGVKKMTNAQLYTGAHKSRFDESGKGKGIDGREERHANKGYVGAYKGEGTYSGTKK